MKASINILLLFLLTVFLVQTAFGQSEADSPLLKDELTDSIKSRTIDPSDPYYFGTYDLQSVQKPYEYNLSSRMRLSSEYPNYVQGYPNYVQAYQNNWNSSDPNRQLMSIILTKIIQSGGNHKMQKKAEVEDRLTIDK